VGRPRLEPGTLGLKGVASPYGNVSHRQLASSVHLLSRSFWQDGGRRCRPAWEKTNVGWTNQDEPAHLTAVRLTHLTSMMFVCKPRPG
jgi:hypothetical protein